MGMFGGRHFLECGLGIRHNFRKSKCVPCAGQRGWWPRNTGTGESRSEQEAGLEVGWAGDGFDGFKERHGNSGSWVINIARGITAQAGLEIHRVPLRGSLLSRLGGDRGISGSQSRGKGQGTYGRAPADPISGTRFGLGTQSHGKEQGTAGSRGAEIPAELPSGKSGMAKQKPLWVRGASLAGRFGALL